MAGSGDRGAGIGSTVDALHDRAVIRSQLLFAVVVVLATFILELLVPDLVAEPWMVGGILLTILTTAATIVVRWHRHREVLVALVPVLDIVAIGLMRIGAPPIGVGLLWIFPTTWLARSFGAPGAIVAVGLACGFIVVSEVMASDSFGVESLLGAVYLPITLVFIASSAVLTARRDAAQAALLSGKTGQLERALRRARRQEGLIVEVLDSVPFGVLRVDREGRGALMNRSYARMFGLDRDAPDSARGGVVLAADRRTRLAADELPFARAARGEEFRTLVWVHDSTGAKRALEVMSRGLVDDDGEPDGAILAARDATIELEAVRARDDLVASVSHDLRTPMTSILGYLDLTLDDPALPERIRTNLEIAERNGNRVLDLIALVLAGSTEDELPLLHAETDLDGLVRDAVAGLRPLAVQNDVTVRLAAPDRVRVDVDAERIRRVLDNLLSNAIKYNRLGGRVDVEVGTHGDQAVVTVRDTGVGIAADDLPRVFDRFYRSELARDSATHGTGLGLGIARDIVERHGGALELESETGVGTTVRLRLPLPQREGERR